MSRGMFGSWLALSIYPKTAEGRSLTVPWLGRNTLTAFCHAGGYVRLSGVHTEGACKRIIGQSRGSVNRDSVTN